MKHLFPFIALLLLLTACRKEQRTGVPPAAVDFSININFPEYANLQVPGGWVYVTGGSQGIILYRKNQDEFVAMDRHCPYQPENFCRVTVDDTQVMARDTACCGSAYLLNGGSVVNGPSSFGLSVYNTSFNGTTLRVYN
jgi:nitrite reductase/ring-hydroxylating ferredoxin subunit